MMPLRIAGDEAVKTTV